MSSTKRLKEVKLEDCELKEKLNRYGDKTKCNSTANKSRIRTEHKICPIPESCVDYQLNKLKLNELISQTATKVETSNYSQRNTPSNDAVIVVPKTKLVPSNESSPLHRIRTAVINFVQSINDSIKSLGHSVGLLDNNTKETRIIEHDQTDVMECPETSFFTPVKDMDQLLVTPRCGRNEMECVNRNNFNSERETSFDMIENSPFDQSDIASAIESPVPEPNDNEVFKDIQYPSTPFKVKEEIMSPDEQRKHEENNFNYFEPETSFYIIENSPFDQSDITFARKSPVPYPYVSEMFKDIQYPSTPLNVKEEIMSPDEQRKHEVISVMSPALDEFMKALIRQFDELSLFCESPKVNRSSNAETMISGVECSMDRIENDPNEEAEKESKMNCSTPSKRFSNLQKVFDEMLHTDENENFQLTPNSRDRKCILGDCSFDSINYNYDTERSSEPDPDNDESTHTNLKAKARLKSLNFRHYKSITIEPSTIEVLGETPHDLESNITKGGYRSVIHYLNVQSKLIKEDFTRPLREGLKLMQTHFSVHGKLVKNDNLSLYPKCKFISKQVYPSTYKFCFDIDNELSTTHVLSKRAFMHSSLLVFSYNNFEDFFFGTIVFLCPEDLKKKILTVRLMVKDSNIHLLNHFNFDSECAMFIPISFYGAYEPILRTFLSFTVKNFPFKKYFIDLENTIASPSYLSPEIRREYKMNTLARSTLNPSQYEAYETALTKELAIIQGPPGTGKTYVGLKIVESFIQNQELQRIRKEPILVVCYTNHALDKFVEGILKYSRNVCRLGASGKNLNVTPYYHESILQAFHGIKTVIQEAAGSKNERCVVVKEDFSSLFHKNGHGFYSLKVPTHTKSMSEFKKLVLNYDTLKSYFCMFVHSSMNKCNKRRCDSTHTEEGIKLPNLYDFLKTKSIIAMTTTKAAKIHDILCSLKCKIVIIEEAAEVVEPHIIASLTRHTQHVIMIGDHQQLKPITCVYELAKKYKLDVSLFERMIENGIPHVQLNVQHRMRPEICSLLVPTIYPKLENHYSVSSFPSIGGMLKNIQFFDHRTPEDSNLYSTHSFENIFEAKILLKLSDYLITQGSAARDITILAAYGNQVQILAENAIKGNYRNNLTSLNISTIDGYQGEESKIILLSLVRSNDRNDIGFLNISNRVCVALSRAKHGMYIIGNMNCLVKRSDLWSKLKYKLQKLQALDDNFTLTCRIHSKKSEIKSVDDFKSCCCYNK